MSICIPEEYLCPISFDLMQFPVQSECGHIFEEDCIRDWLRKNPTCPLDRSPIQGTNLIPALQLQQKIQQFIKDHPEVMISNPQDSGNGSEAGQSVKVLFFKKNFKIITQKMIYSAVVYIACNHLFALKIHPADLLKIMGAAATPIFLDTVVYFLQKKNDETHSKGMEGLEAGSLSAVLVSSVRLKHPFFSAFFGASLLLSDRIFTKMA